MEELNHLNQLSLNHITLNTGHERITQIKDFDKRMYFMMNRFYTASFDELGADLGDNYIAKSVAYTNNSILCSVFSCGVPVITFGISINDRSNIVWKELHNSSVGLLKTSINNPPHGSYLAERLDIGAVTDIDSLLWVGDFVKAYTWVHIASKELKVALSTHDKIKESKYLRFFK